MSVTANCIGSTWDNSEVSVEKPRESVLSIDRVSGLALVALMVLVAG